MDRALGADQLAPYFIAPKRLSNELDCTIGAEPATCVPGAAGAGAAVAVSLTEGFSAGLAVACRVSASLASGLVSGFGATRTTDGCGLASAMLGFAAAGGGGAIAGVASA